MSTCYYLTLSRDDADYRWSIKLVLGKLTQHGMTLRAVVGPDTSAIDPSVFKRFAVQYTGGRLPTILSWADWKQTLLERRELVILDDEGGYISTEDFIDTVESQSDRSDPYHGHLEWLQNHQNDPQVFTSGNRWFLDPEGYSFSW